MKKMLAPLFFIVALAPACVAEPEEIDADTLAGEEGDEDVGTAEDALATSGPTVRVVPDHSHKCFNVWGESTANGAAIRQYDCIGAPNEQFDMIDAGGGYFQMRAKFSGRCVDVPGAYLANGVVLQQWDCWYGDNQLFKAVDAGGGLVNLVAKHSGKCIGVYANSTASGADVVQWDCDGSDNQKFALRRAWPDTDKCDAAYPDTCVAENIWESGYPATNCTYGFHVGAGHYTTTGYSGFYDKIDQCAFWHDKGCWSVNHATWVDEGFAGCSQTVNFIACVEAVTPASHEEQLAKDCILNSLLETGADICELFTYPYGRGLMYPLYDGAYTGGACASTHYAF